MRRLPRYHQSAIQQFQKCGQQYYFRHIMGVVSPPKAALTVGSSVDTATTHNLIQKVQTEQDVSKEEVLDVYSSDFDQRAQETEWGEDDPGKQKDMGAQLVALHHEVIAPKIQPESVQETFEIETDAGYALGGTIDLTEKSGVIVDTKTSKGRYDENAVSRALQPAIYDFAYEALRGKPATGFRFDVLVKPTAKKPPEAQQVLGKVTGEDRAWLFDSIEQVHRSIQAGAFPYAPEGAWWCSKDWCGFWHLCKKGGKK